MKDLREIRGLKFPDEAVVRHFFKRRLHTEPGSVIELGCGAGNNLSLYRAYGWSVTGLDIDPATLSDARANLGDDGVTLVEADLSNGLPDPPAGPYDVLLIPNLLCYLTTAQAKAVLRSVAARMSGRGELFLRTRLTDDYRYARGQQVEPDTFRLETPETGEAGLINRFYTEAELVDLLRATLALREETVLRFRFDNPQQGFRVTNSDLVIWGRVGVPARA